MASEQINYRIVFDDAFTGGIRNAQSATSSFESSLGGLKGALIAAFSIGAIVEMGKGIVDATMKMEGFKNQLNFASGSAAQGAKDLGYITSEAERLGLSLEPTIEAFAKLQGATRGTTLAGQATRDIFAGVSEAATAMHLSSEQASGALLALQQMASKGTVQAEELRGQLGERIPGAFHLAAEAMGVTESALNQMLQKGEVVATDFLPKFATALHRNFGEAAATASDSLVANMNRAKTVIFETQTEIGEFFYPVIAKTLTGFKEIINVVRSHSGQIKEAFMAVVDFVRPIYEALQRFVLKIFESAKMVWAALSQFAEQFKGILGFIQEALVWIIDALGTWYSYTIEFLAVVIDVAHTIYVILEKLGIIWLLAQTFKLVWEIIKGIGSALSVIYEYTLKPIFDAIAWAYEKLKEILGITKDTNVTATVKKIEQTVGGGGTSVGVGAALETAKNLPISKSVAAKEKEKVVTGSKSTSINISINKLVESLNISTTNLKDTTTNIKEAVAKALLEAVNDANLIGNV